MIGIIWIFCLIEKTLGVQLLSLLHLLLVLVPIFFTMEAWASLLSYIVFCPRFSHPFIPTLGKCYFLIVSVLGDKEAIHLDPSTIDVHKAKQLISSLGVGIRSFCKIIH